ncbi:MAG: hypothetical protein EPGJADBJ_00324 [Saprospiraceae bacterium]|nr:hypothetical protein [Saprospiraceae bacterium]
MALQLITRSRSAILPVFPFLLLVLNANSQLEWYPVNLPGRVPVWQIVRSGDVYVLKAETGIYRSPDEGQTWNLCAETAPADGYLTATNTGSLLHAFPGNGLLISNDEGTTWQELSANVPAAANGLAANSTYIFYATANGIYRYLNTGGGPANVLHFSTYQQFANVKESAGIVWACSNDVLFKSTDNGNNWIEVASIPEIRSFQPNGDTIMLATSDALWRSDNGGSDWLTLDNFSGTAQQLDWQEGYWLALTTETPVLWSTDGGQNWFPPATGPFPDYSVTDVVKNGPLWLVSSQLGGVFRSPNNGEYWIVSTTGLESSAVYSPEWIDCAGEFLMFNTGFTYLSCDGGDIWFMPLPTSAYDPFQRVVWHKNSHFALSLWGSIFQQELGNPYGWVKRSGGYLYNSTFGYGLTTRLYDLGDRMAVTGKYAAPHLVYQSTNGGLSWPEVGELPQDALSVAAFNERLYCLTSGYDCQSSADAGASWTPAGEGLSETWTDASRLCIRSGMLFFLDEDKFYLRSETEQLFLQIPLPAGMTGRLWDADCVDGMIWIATDGGIFSSADWGNNWIFASENLTGMDFSKAQLRYHKGSVFVLLPASQPPLWKAAFPSSRAKEPVEKSAFSLFPNPLPDGVPLTVKPKANFIKGNENFELQVYDLQGKIVLSSHAYTTGGQEMIIEMDDLTPGIYHVQVHFENWVANRKLLKM